MSSVIQTQYYSLFTTAIQGFSPDFAIRYLTGRRFSAPEAREMLSACRRFGCSFVRPSLKLALFGLVPSSLPMRFWSRYIDNMIKRVAHPAGCKLLIWRMVGSSFMSFRAQSRNLPRNCIAHPARKQISPHNLSCAKPKAPDFIEIPAEMAMRPGGSH